MATMLFQCLAQSTDMHIDRPFVYVTVTSPNRLEKLLARENTIRMLQQHL